MNTMIQDSIIRELVLKAPKERVFQALTDPKEIVKWFPDGVYGVDGKFEKGERPVFDFGEYGKVTVYVVAADPHHYFAYRWASSGQGPVDDPLAVPNTLVEFRLEDAPGGTLLKLTESGFASLPKDVIEKSFGDNSEGWDQMLSRLEKYMAA